MPTVRDRDYLLDRAGVVFNVIGDVHPPTHYLGYVKYYLDDKGDRQLFGRTYRQSTVVSKAFGILADWPECYLYSDTIGCVITGVPRQDVTRHYSCRHALAVLHQAPELLGDSGVARDLKAVIDRIVDLGAMDLLGVTGSFLVGCFSARPSSTRASTSATPNTTARSAATTAASTAPDARGHQRPGAGRLWFRRPGRAAGSGAVQ